MLVWVLNTPLFFEHSPNVFVKVFYTVMLLKSVNSLLYFFWFIKYAIKHLIIKLFGLSVTIPLTRKKRLLTTCYWASFNERATYNISYTFSK